MGDNRIADGERGLYRLPTGCTSTVRECEALDEAGVQSCAVRPTWRIIANPLGGPGGHGAAEWLVCQPHLGEAVMLADENYGGPVVVHRA